MTPVHYVRPAHYQGAPFGRLACGQRLNERRITTATVAHVTCEWCKAALERPR